VYNWIGGCHETIRLDSSSLDLADGMWIACSSRNSRSPCNLGSHTTSNGFAANPGSHLHTHTGTHRNHAAHAHAGHWLQVDPPGRRDGNGLCARRVI
jgi:hypothetical protein